MELSQNNGASLTFQSTHIYNGTIPRDKTRKLLIAHQILHFTPEDMTLEDGGLMTITVTTRECKTSPLLCVDGSSGAEQNTVDTVTGDLCVTARIN